jgi:hypothetical protein
MFFVVPSLAKYPRITKWRAGLKVKDFYQKCYKGFTQFMREAMSAKAGK